MIDPCFAFFVKMWSQQERTLRTFLLRYLSITYFMSIDKPKSVYLWIACTDSSSRYFCTSSRRILQAGNDDRPIRKELCQSGLDKKIGTRREISISMNLYLNIQEQIKCIENSTKIRKNGDFNRSNRKTHKNNEL